MARQQISFMQLWGVQCGAGKWSWRQKYSPRSSTVIVGPACMGALPAQYQVAVDMGAYMQESDVGALPHQVAMDMSAYMQEPATDCSA